ncbi:hypothetical protein LRH25_23620 [Ideonella azotifigens]|uniref:Uncharacterized protein n=1 Tax=Ideonella azotifigens TaxID=513160 RepID=A0ABN1JV17_9BURK|nr:hypothetical protein [Ideonella azotifigens]MCD2343320.1 hypothetical protein [Ideonella azotifigens]
MEREPQSWQARLPAELQAQVCWPVRIESHHDDGVPASKWRGYDALGLLCYYRHHFSQWDYSFDDEDQPCMRMLRAEDFEAWRCLNGQWLRTVEVIEGEGSCGGRAHHSGFEIVPPQHIPRL